MNIYGVSILKEGTRVSCLSLHCWCAVSNEEKSRDWKSNTHTHTHTHTQIAHIFSLTWSLYMCSFHTFFITSKVGTDLQVECWKIDKQFGYCREVKCKLSSQRPVPLYCIVYYFIHSFIHSFVCLFVCLFVFPPSIRFVGYCFITTKAGCTYSPWKMFLLWKAPLVPKVLEFANIKENFYTGIECSVTFACVCVCSCLCDHFGLALRVCSYECMCLARSGALFGNFLQYESECVWGVWVCMTHLILCIGKHTHTPIHPCLHNRTNSFLKQASTYRQPEMWR